ncbi:TetR/AcrR family transcriptional regulator [Streptosporangium sp. NPDC000396]|uniref:TetR/AcrR family transcriptional regulator n=1 Tax=Streptosporangium sp. NPDC000396 TaxID=3366185 RepID=UPI0036A94B36
MPPASAPRTFPVVVIVIVIAHHSLRLTRPYRTEWYGTRSRVDSGPPLIQIGRLPGDMTAQARIRNAAIAHFARDGFQKTNLRAVAADVGVSIDLIFHHFGSKDGLRTACDEHVLHVLPGRARCGCRICIRAGRRHDGRSRPGGVSSAPVSGMMIGCGAALGLPHGDEYRLAPALGASRDPTSSRVRSLCYEGKRSGSLPHVKIHVGVLSTWGAKRSLVTRDGVLDC